MFTTALLIGLVMFIAQFSDNGMGDIMLKRPLVVSALTGLVLGDLQTGVIMGASLEVVFLGITSIGGAMPSDSTTGAIFGTAFAILSHQGTEVALTLAIPISLLAVILNQASFIVIGGLMDKIDKYAAVGDQKGLTRLHFAIMILKPLSYGVLGFFGILLGAETISTFVNSIPSVLMNGLTVTGKLLPALGLAILLNMLWEKKIALFFFLGFILVSYLKLPVIAVAIMGVVIAGFTAVKEQEVNEMIKSSAGNSKTISDDEEDFFNE